MYRWVRYLLVMLTAVALPSPSRAHKETDHSGGYYVAGRGMVDQEEHNRIVAQQLRDKAAARAAERMAAHVQMKTAQMCIRSGNAARGAQLLYDACKAEIYYANAQNDEERAIVASRSAWESVRDDIWNLAPRFEKCGGEDFARAITRASLLDGKGAADLFERGRDKLVDCIFDGLNPDPDARASHGRNGRDPYSKEPRSEPARPSGSGLRELHDQRSGDHH